jgi:hypothetical protein
MKRQTRAKSDTKGSGGPQKTKPRGRLASRTIAQVKRRTGEMARGSQTGLRKAAVAIGTVLGKAMGRIEKALK